jgi:CheY-like chemotaxis protein
VSSPDGGRVLVVDDSAVNRMVLTKALNADGHTSLTAEDGLQALELLQAGGEPCVDVVLLDLEMPMLDGYETLARMKADERLRQLPVIVVSSIEDLDSVVRCIKIGATDYLPKPFNAEVLRARLNASLAEKRLHDLQVEYLEQVGRVTDAAAAIEAETFAPETLDAVAARDDALGQLARVPSAWPGGGRPRAASEGTGQQLDRDRRGVRPARSTRSPTRTSSAICRRRRARFASAASKPTVSTPWWRG